MRRVLCRALRSRLRALAHPGVRQRVQHAGHAPPTGRPHAPARVRPGTDSAAAVGAPRTWPLRARLNSCSARPPGPQSRPPPRPADMYTPPSLSRTPPASRRRRHATLPSRRSAPATRRFRRRRAAVRCKRVRYMLTWACLTTPAAGRQMRKRPGTWPTVTAQACSRIIRCVGTLDACCLRHAPKSAHAVPLRAFFRASLFRARRWAPSSKSLPHVAGPPSPALHALLHRQAQLFRARPQSRQ